MMIRILKDGNVINTIVACESFAETYCEKHGYAYEAIPEPVEPAPVPAEQREQAYNTEAVIEWDGEMLTVTEAAQLWQYYAAEGSDKATALTALIAEAKQIIREKYPDTEVLSDGN